MYLLSASPYSKIFLPEWWDRIVDNPNVITDETIEFSFNVPFPTGAVGMFEYDRIMRLDDLPCVKRRLAQDRKGLYNFITGGESGQEFLETALWGIVSVNLEMDLTRYTVDQMALQAEALRQKDEKKLQAIERKQKEFSKKFQQQYTEAQEGARAKANDKVMNFIKFTVENMKDQWEKLRQEGKNPYTASVSELGCLYVLKDYLKEKSAKRAVLNKEAQEFMEKINTF